jgi:hypothetical protein
MPNNDVKDSSGVKATSDDPSTVFASRRASDERAITLAGHLLMAGIALEKQVKTLVKARVRT